MPDILLIISIITLFVTLNVINFCLKYILKLEKDSLESEIRNKIKINSMQKYYQDCAEVREKDFMAKLVILSQHSDNLILSNDIKSTEIIIIPCHENSTNNQFYSEFRVKETLFNNKKINFSYNLMNMDLEQVEQMLTNVLAKYLMDKNFVKGKYDIKNNFVRFSCNFYEKPQ